MKVSLYPHQWKAVNEMHNGCILCGGVGTGKSRTSLAYFYEKVCGGNTLDISPNHKVISPRNLFIITTARKRDTLEWDGECDNFALQVGASDKNCPIQVTIDSWNNIGKYVRVKDSFFIFDEQRIVGSGAWVKSFLKISKNNQWILLTATPGDNWGDYIPVFIANGFYKNRSEFLSMHAVYNRYCKFPKVDRYIGTSRLNRFRKQVLVAMPFQKKTIPHHHTVKVEYDKPMYDYAMTARKNPYDKTPIRDISELCYTLRKITNSNSSRYETILELLQKHKRVVIFYNFNYELEILKTLPATIAEWNGHRHDPVPDGHEWCYLVQYTAGAEGWNCVSTDTMIFYSQNYSYKIMAQAEGRIDRLNTSYTDLHYYHLISTSKIDLAIRRALNNKKSFNDSMFISKGS